MSDGADGAEREHRAHPASPEGDARIEGPLHLFEAYGVELEYMIVDAQDLRVRPIADEVFFRATGSYEGEYEQGPIAWSNELVSHVIELKTNGPVRSLGGLGARFQEDLAGMQTVLDHFGARLMPTAMHPWMDPLKETVLWTRDHSPVYEKFDEIFSCRGHGWSNLQSMHVNLPFADDAEFARLHAAIRLLLPILPALAASSPLVEGKATGILDNRLEYYRNNARRVPRVSGLVVPDSAGSRAEYESSILEPLYRDLAPFDPEGILRYEWANARGCIARFDRNAIEIRVLDLQECPRADVAVAALVVAVLRAIIEERWLPLAAQQALDTARLAAIFRACLKDAEQTVIDDAAILSAFGMPAAGVSAGALWAHLLDAAGAGLEAPEFAEPLGMIVSRGTLARRILRAAGPAPDKGRIDAIYRHLCHCLDVGALFDDRDLGAT